MKKNAEKRRFMPKKIALLLAALPVFALFAGMCGCARPAGQTPLSLLRAVAARDPAYAFPAEALFYKDGVYFAFYSLHGENDLLLSLRVNERQTVIRAAVTAKRGSEAAARDLAPLGLLLGGLLLPESDPEALAAATGLRLLPREPAEAVSLYAAGRDRAGLFRGKNALCFFVELREYAAGEEQKASPEAKTPSEEAERRMADARSLPGKPKRIRLFKERLLKIRFIFARFILTVP